MVSLILLPSRGMYCYVPYQLNYILMRIFGTAPKGNDVADLDNARYINLALRDKSILIFLTYLLYNYACLLNRLI